MPPRFRSRVKRIHPTLRLARSTDSQSTHHRLSRRTFLIRGSKLAAAIAIGSGCAVVSLPTPEMDAFKPMVEEALQNPEIVTALREGQSVQKVVEKNPQIKEVEYGYVKEKPGRIRMVGKNGRAGFVEIEINKHTRSRIHTHNPSLRSHPTVSLILSTSPSMVDVLGFLRHFFNPALVRPRFRFSHIAAISTEGKLMGYYSMKYGRKMEPLRKKELSEGELAAKNAFFEGLDRLAEKSSRVEGPIPLEERIENNRAYHTELWRMHELGLRIRITPMPGFIYKNGYFQPTA